MNDQQAREFVEMLAVPERTAPPPCPLCGAGHELEARCAAAPAFASVVHSPPDTVVLLDDHRGGLDAMPVFQAA